MATNSTVHTFEGGMNKDLDKSLMPKNKYYHAENLRLSPTNDGKGFILKNVLGTQSVITFSANYTICGYCLVRNKLVLFLRNLDSSSSRIVYYTLDQNDNPTSTIPVIVYADNNTEDGTKLNLGEGIKAIGRYESSSIIKVYWCGDNNPTRFINLESSNKNSSGQYVSTTKLEFIPSAILSGASFAGETSGKLQTGVVYYSYQFFNRNGSESLFAPLSRKINLSNEADKGSPSNLNSGKGVRLQIEGDPSYDYIRLIRIHFSTFGGIPSVTVVSESVTANNSTLLLVDSGNSIAELVLEDFSNLSRLLFSAKEISSKQDYLLYGNITESRFDIEFDVRVYRFNEFGIARLEQADGSYYLLYAAGVSRIGAVGTTASAGDWEYFNISNVYQSVLGEGVGYGIDWSIPKYADCINPSNGLSAGAYPYIYKADGLTIGGTGKNLSYVFDTTLAMILDREGTNTKGSNRTSHSEGDLLAKSLNNDSGYILNNQNAFVGYCPNEVYRFGNVLYDSRGRESFVNWIGDIKFPSFYDLGIANRALLTSVIITAPVLAIKFTFNETYPTSISGHKIFRAIRTSSDRSIVANGVLSHTYKYNNHYYSPIIAKSESASATYYGESTEVIYDLVTFVSPEINYGQYQYKVGDRIAMIYSANDYGSYFPDITYHPSSFIKYSSLESTEPLYITIDDLKIIGPKQPAVTPVLTDYDIVGVFDKYHHYGTDSGAVGDYGGDHSPIGTAAVIDTTSSTYDISDYNALLDEPLSLGYAQIQRDVTQNRYGGITFYGRENTTYIPCSYKFVYSATPVTSTIYGGDTYVAMFDHLRAIFDTESGDPRQNVMYVPVETFINLDYSEGDLFSRVSDIPSSLSVHEVAGNYEGAATIIFEQEKDYYLYNTVYSVEPEFVGSVEKSTLIPDIFEFDTRILISERKFNNELGDSWTKFKPNNFLDVDSAYGPLSDLFNFKDRIYFFQPNGYGTLSLNDRSVITDDSSNKLVVGNGGLLDRYDYISHSTGVTGRFNVVTSKRGFYWIDESKKELMRFGGEEEQFSKMEGLDSLLKSYNSISNVRSVFDSEYDEILFSLNSDKVIYINDLIGAIGGIYTFRPRKFFQLNCGFLSTSIQTDKTIHRHNASSLKHYNYFYNNFYPSQLTIISGDGFSIPKVWDNVEYYSQSILPGGILNNADTFNSIRFYNDYQNTDWWTFILNGEENTSTARLPLRRRERNFTFYIPRSSVNKDISFNSDIFNANNLNRTQQFKERLRSNYIYGDFKYENVDGLGSPKTIEFSIPYIEIKYRASQR